MEARQKNLLQTKRFQNEMIRGQTQDEITDLMNSGGPEKKKNHMQTRNYSTMIRGIQHLGYVMNQEANLEKEKKFYNYVTMMIRMMRMMRCYGDMTRFSTGNTHMGGTESLRYNS